MTSQKLFHQAVAYGALAAVIAIAGLNPEHAAAKGPSKPDFTIELGDESPSVFTGAVSEIGSGERMEIWTDDNGDVWFRIRYYHNLSEDFYFDVVLPWMPKNGRVYDIVLTAGPWAGRPTERFFSTIGPSERARAGPSTNGNG